MMPPGKERSIAGALSVTGAVGIALFQALLALGLPLGKAAWGGSSADLSVGLRISSAIAVVLWLAIAAILAARAGFLNVMTISQDLAVRVTWIVLGLVILSCLLNWASRSKIERNIWGPITTVLAASLFVLAKSERPDVEEETPLMS